MVTTEMIRELRECTGAGIIACKQALETARGDFQAAMRLLQRSGQVQAEKKSSRVAAEGLVNIKVSADSKTAAMLEVNCETDFVAREETFIQFVSMVNELQLQTRTTDRELLLTSSLGACTVEQTRQALVVKVGENIQLRRLALIESANNLGTYVHAGRIGAIVELQGGDGLLAKELAMHIVANNPLMIGGEGPGRERPVVCQSISAQPVQASAEPQVIEGRIDTRAGKMPEGACLLDQAFIKDPTITVAQLLEKTNVKVVRFVRYALGEGIEKSPGDVAQPALI